MQQQDITSSLQQLVQQARQERPGTTPIPQTGVMPLPARTQLQQMVELAHKDRGATMFAGQDAPGLLDDLKYGWRAFGPRNLADTLGLPVDLWNAAGNFLKTHPEVAMDPGEGYTSTMPEAVENKRQSMEGFTPIDTGSSQSIQRLMGDLKIPTSTAEEEGVHLDWLGRTLETVGQFTGPSALIGGAGIVKGAITGGIKNAIKGAAKDALYAGIGPGLAGATAAELAPDENDQETWKNIAALTLGVRPSVAVAGLRRVRNMASSVIGANLTTGSRVGNAMVRIAGGPEGIEQTIAELDRAVPVSPGTGTIPIDRKSVV